MAQHTKGPWHIGSEQDYSVDRYAKNAEWARVRGLDGGLIATIESVHPAGKRQSKDFDIEAANARLIAASSDLLAALKDAEFLLRKISIHPNDAWAMRDSFTRSAQDARDAISKAQGA